MSRLIDCMVLYAALNIISVISQQQLTYSCTSWVLPVLDYGSGVSRPRTLWRKNPEDPVLLEPRTSRLCITHFTTEPHRTFYI